jgi:hypothetical protein
MFKNIESIGKNSICIFKIYRINTIIFYCDGFLLQLLGKTVDKTLKYLFRFYVNTSTFE